MKKMNLLNKLKYISERADCIINENWLFFSDFNSKKYNLSYEKVMGEFLLYCLFTKDKKLYLKVLNKKFNKQACIKYLVNLTQKYRGKGKYLKPNEKLDLAWKKRKEINYSEIKNIFLNSELIYEEDLYLCDYLDLYNFTHDIFWGLDFGKIPINNILDSKTIIMIFDKAIKNYYFSILCHHYDLASENIIVLLILSDFVDNLRKNYFNSVFSSFYREVAIPFLDKKYDLKKEYKAYHMILVFGILGNIYEY